MCINVVFLHIGFRHLGSQLVELERAIEKMMEADFVHFALEDIHHRLPNGLRKDGNMQVAFTEGDSSEVSQLNGLTIKFWLNFLLFVVKPRLSF